MQSVSEIWGCIQSNLFPYLTECLDDKLSLKLKRVITTLEIVQIERHWLASEPMRMGRPPYDRRALARAFVVKAAYDLPTTELLIETLRAQPNLRRVCGFERVNDIPSASTFSRAFKHFADTGLGDRVHKALVRLYVGEDTLEYVTRDSTPIEAREKPDNTKEKKTASPRRRGRPRSGEIRAPRTRLEAQRSQSAQEAIDDLPVKCDTGFRKDSKGFDRFWNGYKAHADVSPNGLPLTVLTTPASLHDSQVAIPMAKLTSERVNYTYSIMDAAYDANHIRKNEQDLGHSAIIAANPRINKVAAFDADTLILYNKRSVSERFNARLKDEFGGRHLCRRR